jgi:chromosomal replication initiation ATPase DnaA
MTGQLAFDLAATPSLRREDFFVAPSNRLALRAVEDWRGWPDGKLALIGPEGSGKTHLATLWAAEAGGCVVPAAALAGIAGSGTELADLAAAGRVAVEDAAGVAGDPAGERALLHLHNLVLAGRGRLLLTARAAPARWGVRLPDLASRLAATATATLEPPDDALLAAALVKHFADRQLAVAPALIPWLAARMERSLAAAHGLVARLDARALAEGRPVTRALAAAVLQEADGAPVAALDSRPGSAP